MAITTKPHRFQIGAHVVVVDNITHHAADTPPQEGVLIADGRPYTVTSHTHDSDGESYITVSRDGKKEIDWWWLEWRFDFADRRFLLEPSFSLDDLENAAALVEELEK